MKIELVKLEIADGFFKAYFRKTAKAKLKKDELFPRPNPCMIVQGHLEVNDPTKVIVSDNENKLNQNDIIKLIQKELGF